jgi:hypothetical protein
MGNAVSILEDEKSLDDILVVPSGEIANLLEDKKAIKNLKLAVEKTTGLVYTADEEGLKEMRRVCANINKIKGYYEKTAKEEVKRRNQATTDLAEPVFALCRALEANRLAVTKQTEESTRIKLDAIKAAVNDAILFFLDSKGVKPEYRKYDIRDLVKLGSFTAKNQLTGAATKEITSIADSCLAEQTRIEARVLMLENCCFKADITPLQKEHFGSVFYAEESLFQEKLKELIDVELSRKAEMEARIKRQQEADNQRKLDEALAEQKAEALRLVKEEQARIAAIEAEKMAAAQKVAENFREQEKLKNNYGVESENLMAKIRTERDEKRNFIKTVEPEKQPESGIKPGYKVVDFQIWFKPEMVTESFSDALKQSIKETQVRVLLSAQFPEHKSNAVIHAWVRKQMSMYLSENLLDSVTFD